MLSTIQQWWKKTERRWVWIMLQQKNLLFQLHLKCNILQGWSRLILTSKNVHVFMFGVQWGFVILSSICCRFDGILAIRALLTFLYPEGIKDIPVQSYDSLLDYRDKGVHTNLYLSKGGSVTEGIKRFRLASQMTDVLVSFPPQWPADKAGIKERSNIRLLCTNIQTSTYSL